MVQTSSYRLSEKYGFSPETTSRIRTLVNEVSSYKTYHDFFAAVDMQAVKEYRVDARHGVTVIDIPARKKAKKEGSSDTLVVHLPMGNPLDQNQQYQMAVLSTLFPTKRIIGFGNPSGGVYAYDFQNLTVSERWGIATGLNVRPLVAAEFAYLESEAVVSVTHIGFSFGSSKALIASSFAPVGSVKKVIAIELLSHRRNPLRLLRDFQQSIAPLGEYVDRTGLTTFKDARHDAAKGNDYNAGLRRVINIAIGLMLSVISSARLVQNVLNRHPKSTVSVIWGSGSELVNNKKIRKAIKMLTFQYSERIKSKCLLDEKHALANDVFLHAAIMYEFLEKE